MQDFRELTVWQKAHNLTLGAYQVTARLPKSEEYGLTSQMRRSSSSIPTNIAEGCGHDSRGNFTRFLHTAAGSASELEYQLLVRDLQLLPEEDFKRLTHDVQHVKRMLSALIRSIQAYQETDN